MSTDRLVAHKCNQWKLFNPDGFLNWIRDNTEILTEPHGKIIVWKVDP